MPPSRPNLLGQGDDKFIFMGKAAWSSGITVEQALQVYRLGVLSAVPPGGRTT